MYPSGGAGDIAILSERYGGKKAKSCRGCVNEDGVKASPKCCTCGVSDRFSNFVKCSRRGRRGWAFGPWGASLVISPRERKQAGLTYLRAAKTLPK